MGKWKYLEYSPIWEYLKCIFLMIIMSGDLSIVIALRLKLKCEFDAEVDCTKF